MSAAKLDIIIEQGASWKKTLALVKSNKQPKSLVGYTGKAQIRVKPESTEVLEEFTVEFLAPRTSGKLSFSLTDEETALLTFTTAAYDLFITSPTGIRTKLVKGSVTVTPSITKFTVPTP